MLLSHAKMSNHNPFLVQKRARDAVGEDRGPAQREQHRREGPRPRPGRIRGGYTLPNLNVGFIGPQNTLVGPIWRCCGQKTRPPSHFWVPFQPNLVFALFTWENGPKLAKKEQISKFA